MFLKSQKFIENHNKLYRYNKNEYQVFILPCNIFSKPDVLKWIIFITWVRSGHIYCWVKLHLHLNLEEKLFKNCVFSELFRFPYDNH